MNKMTSLRILHVLFVSMTMVILTECKGMAPIITPTPQSPTAVPNSPTAMPPYIHYIPPKPSEIHLDFDYPSSWVFREELDLIVLLDPRSHTVPTPAYDDYHPMPSDFGIVHIRMHPVKPNQTVDAAVEAYKQSGNGIPWITALDDYKIKLDGYDAIVLESQIERSPDNFYSSTMFQRDTFFAIKDQIYQITLIVAKKDRGGEFEKGYEYFFNSIRIVP